MILRSQFPSTVLSVVPVGSGLLISGYVDQSRADPDHLRIAKEYYPKIINNMTVSGVQQGLLHVKVMEVSRTKLRQLGFDFAKINGGNLFVSQVSGLISSISGGSITSGNSPTAQFNIGHGGIRVFRRDGRPAAGRAGQGARRAEPGGHQRPARPLQRRRPVLLPAQRRHHRHPRPADVNYGTIVDVVPIVLGNGRIRLEVRPEVSEIDKSLTVVGGPPSLKTRVVETGVEMKAGQTLAIAGLVQNTVEVAERRPALDQRSPLPRRPLPQRQGTDQRGRDC